jgi:hypothetical protein
MAPLGYVILQHIVRLGRPGARSAKWLEQIPRVFREEVLGGKAVSEIPGSDP